MMNGPPEEEIFRHQFDTYHEKIECYVRWSHLLRGIFFDKKEIKSGSL